MNIKEKAKEFAIKAHKGQVRKNEKDKPMIMHPISVAELLEEYDYDDNVVAAGYLHDVVEDTKYTIEDIEKEFGKDIASLVMGASEPDKSLSWEERKQHTIDETKILPLRNKLVICADKINNLEDMMIKFEKNGTRDFSAFKRGEKDQKWYYTSVYKSLIYNEDENFDEFKYLTELRKYNYEKDIIVPLINDGKVVSYKSSEYAKDMGTPERYYSVCSDYKEGRVSGKNLRNKQKALFLDRDGTINKYVGFLRNIDDFELIDGVAPAIQKINESGYLAIVVTNQPVIARGEVSFDELEEIHNKMETLLGKEGAYLDAIYYCPHHPHKGYEGERPELKIECKCRKPKPGMLLKAAEEFNIDLSQSWMIGDGENDVIAGINAGCKTVLLSDDDKNYGQTETMKSLDEFTKSLF